MERLTKALKKFCMVLDRLAGLCFAGVMLLIIANIITRTAFNHPIMGTYEMVGFLTALGIGFALAHCFLQDGHIAVSFVVDRLSLNTQSIVAIFVNLLASVFMFAVGWYLMAYGLSMKLNGSVSLTAEIPIYPFIFMVAVGVFALSLAVFYKVIVSCQALQAANKIKRAL